MKKVQRIFIVILLAAIPGIISAKDPIKTTETVKFITSIDCDACVNKIMTNLPQEKGIKDVKCDLKTKMVTVTYKKEKNNPDEIKKTLEKLGYTAKEIIPDNAIKKE